MNKLLADTAKSICGVFLICFLLLLLLFFCVVVKYCCFSIRHGIGEYFISLPGWPGGPVARIDAPWKGSTNSPTSSPLQQGWLRQAPNPDWYMARVRLGCAPQRQKRVPGVPVEAEAQTEASLSSLTHVCCEWPQGQGTPHVAVRDCPLHSRSWEFRLGKIQTTTPSLVPECLWTIFEALLPPTDYSSKGNMLVTHSQALHHYLVFILLHVK